ncbi:hypothetical protein EES39_19275 [Streptomyces sp. ADI92-24]|nr:hypothetical protein EES39_19275 [Streptomyces sp. ADI92-24]
MPWSSVAALQLSFAEVSVMELAVGVPGAVGALSPGTLPPSQEAPFSLQPVAEPEPEPVPLKPKETLAPGATEPFQLRFLAVQ